MNKEQIIDEVFKRYLTEMMFHPEDNWLEELDGMDLGTGEIKKVYRQYSPKEFINKCKTDSEFSEKWGLKIEERELSLEERRKLANYDSVFVSPMTVESWDRNNIPTKLITITYNNETIEDYE
jgi:hypothetical protein